MLETFSSFVAFRGIGYKYELWLWRMPYLCLLNEWVSEWRLILRYGVFKLEWALACPRRCVKCRLLDPTSRASDSEGLRQGLRICISTKLPGHTKGAGSDNTLWEPSISNIVWPYVLLVLNDIYSHITPSTSSWNSLCLQTFPDKLPGSGFSPT